jgi:hypothetical protein
MQIHQFPITVLILLHRPHTRLKQKLLNIKYPEHKEIQFHMKNIYRVIINDCPIIDGVKKPQNFGCAATLPTLDKLVDRFPLPPVASPIGDTSLTHVMKFAAHSTTSSTPTAMRQSFIMTLQKSCSQIK